MMRSFTLSELKPLLQARMQGEDRTLSQVTTDSRNLQPGDLFLALRGDRFDGHDFLQQAESKGAGAIVAEQADALATPVLLVEDSLRALGQIGAFNRSLFENPVAAITGSNGKTTVKELLRSILLQQGPVLATRGNLNNAIGVPLTLLELAPEHRAAVVELGASGPGEIAWTASLASPRVSILTNAGEAHMAGFGSYEGLVRAKGEIIDETAGDGVVVLNGDDPASGNWRQRAGDRRVIAVSARGDTDADLYATDIAEASEGLQFVAHLGAGCTIPVSLRLNGRHNVSNALLAIGAARALNIEPACIERGLASAGPVQGRMVYLSLGPGKTLIDDSYNANPTAMRAALETLARRPGRRIAVLGDMAELGGDPDLQHQAIGELARQLGIDELYARGRFAPRYGAGFGQHSHVLHQHEELAQQLLAELAAQRPDEPVTLLVKGSRSAGMDRVVTLLHEKVHP